MTSKTFKSAVTNRTLNVEGFFNGAFSVVFSDDSSRDLMLQGDDAPALALAILEAAGHVRDACSDNDADVAMEWLHSAIARQAKQSAEAKEQAELEAEALELINAYRDAMGFKPCDWDAVEESDLKNWLAVARKAREMAKGSTNGR